MAAEERASQRWIPPVLWHWRTSRFCRWIETSCHSEPIVEVPGVLHLLLFPWDAAGVVYIASIRSLSPFRRPGKLNVGVDTIQHGVEGLTYLLTESSKLMISETDFQDSIHVLGFSDELNKLLLQLYLDNRKEIRSILSELAPKLPSYHSLEWRLDVQLASRSLRQQIKPAVTIKLHLHQNEDQTAQVLQTDPSTLLHLIQQLEQALGEMKTNHCRRIVRNMK
ncbi:COMM domain-containing protein 2 isoform X7 [Balearica regulorum gibbericeps]|uniref:COMM domain-containing protein 2 isoform X7 n=1 Tax=Balearica regulorum gibbericeps TaxID=100784 RepID=UPI003F61E21E